MLLQLYLAFVAVSILVKVFPITSLLPINPAPLEEIVEFLNSPYTYIFVGLIIYLYTVSYNVEEILTVYLYPSVQMNVPFPFSRSF